MSRRHLAIVSLLALLTAVPAVAQLEPIDALEAAVESLRGDEVYAEIPFEIPPFGTVTIVLDGVAFCMPPDPTAEPAPEPTPPNNIYGCVNDVTLDLAPEGAPDRWTMTVGASTLFLDAETSRPGATGDGYITGMSLLACTVDLVDAGDCTEVQLVPGSTVPSVADLDGVFTDFVVQGAWALMAGEIEAAIGDLVPEFELLLTYMIALANEELCSSTASEEMGFGSLKARFR